ncbi:PH domain-containing protein [Botrimarina sp.]|uniref:PH domain-containing protein n=1 Tax=Botrimarina sp. TaxID=2795802 RepID=UPI0032F03370
MTDDPDAEALSSPDNHAGRDERPLDPRERFQRAASARQSADVDPESDLWSGSYSHLAMLGVWIGGAAATVAAVVVGLLASLTGAGWMILLACVVGLWLVLGGWYAYRRYSVHYNLTTQRLIHESGLLWRTVDRVELIDVDDVTYRQGPVERLFSVGTIVVNSSDRTTPELHLPGIDNVREVANLIDDARRKERRSRGLHVESI